MSFLKLGSPALRNPKQLVGLQAQPPARMIEAIRERQRCVQLAARPIHGLQEEMPEGQLLKPLRLRSRLRIDQLQFVSAALLEPGARLRADTNPIQSRRSSNGSVCLHSDLKVAGVESIDQLAVKLKKRFPAGANYKSIAGCGGCGPLVIDGRSQGLGSDEVSAATSIGIGKIGVAELADCRRAVLLASRPEIASGKSAKDCRPARLRAFTLEGVEDFLDSVAHKNKLLAISC